jgi:hypothetical protein
VGPHVALGRVLAHAEGDAGHGLHLRVTVENTGQRVVEHRAVVDARAHHALAVHLDTVVQQRPQPAQAGGAPAVAQHGGADLGIGGVDADPQRGQPLGHDPFEVGFGEAGERREVPIQEGEAIVVVLDVQALPEPLGELVDEAELAVVVTGPHLVEQGGVDLDAERLVPLTHHRDGDLETPASQLHLEDGLVGEPLVLDDISGDLAAHGDDLVAGGQAGPGGR